MTKIALKSIKFRCSKVMLRKMLIKRYIKCLHQISNTVTKFRLAVFFGLHSNDFIAYFADQFDELRFVAWLAFIKFDQPFF